MLLKTFPLNSQEQDARRVALEQMILEFINEFNKTSKLAHQGLEEVISACDEYLVSIPWKDNREYFFYASAEQKSQFRSAYPNAEAIFELQKTLVNYQLLPEASSLAKSRWALFKAILNPSPTPGLLIEGRRLRSHQWPEFKFKGNLEASKWMDNRPGYHLLSLNEALAKRAKSGIGMHNVFYATPEQGPQFLTSFDQEGRLIDQKGQRIDTSKKRLMTRCPEMTLYVFTAKGLYVFPDDNEDNYQCNIRHSSMLAGHPVLCAGMVEIKDGAIITINNHSGHYEPTKKNFDLLVKFLEQNHIDTQKVTLDYKDYNAVVSRAR